MYLETYPISAGNPVDGWWYKKLNDSSVINWSGVLSSSLMLEHVAQLSFTCYINSTPVTIQDVPYITMSMGAGNTGRFAFGVSDLEWFAGPNEYTFVVNINGSSPGVSYFGSTKVPLVYKKTLSAGYGYFDSDVFSDDDFNINPIDRIQLKITSDSDDLDFVAENMQIEINSKGEPYPVIEYGTYQFLFTSAVVNQKYLHNTTNYLYLYFFQQPMLSIVEYNS
jgi:hypothetical protein